MKMKVKIISAGLFVLLLAGQAFAHTLYFTLYDDGENSIELEGMYSTGEMAMKTPVRLYDQKTGKLLWEGKTDEFGICTFTRPDAPYEVELDAGPGHQARENGI
jgi:uncharacterized lipoprotein NlpE involved in copper resistance